MASIHEEQGWPKLSWKRETLAVPLAAVTKSSTDTALRDIQELLTRGILLANPGGGRSTSYRLAEPENVTVTTIHE